MMYRSTTYSALREHLKDEMDLVVNNHTPLIIHRKNGQNLVLISEEDYSALDETAYLLRSPTNKKRLRSAIKSKKRIRYNSIQDLKNELGV